MRAAIMILILPAILFLACGNDKPSEPDPTPEPDTYIITVFNRNNPSISAFLSNEGEIYFGGPGTQINEGISPGLHNWTVTFYWEGWYGPYYDTTYTIEGYIYIDKNMSCFIANPDTVEWD